jgi:hypothetical protein
MATIVIKDLSENVELDRKAMQAISGGARWRAQVRAVGIAPTRGSRIVDLRTGARPRAAGKQAK